MNLLVKVLRASKPVTRADNLLQTTCDNIEKQAAKTDENARNGVGTINDFEEQLEASGQKYLTLQKIKAYIANPSAFAAAAPAASAPAAASSAAAPAAKEEKKEEKKEESDDDDMFGGGGLFGDD